VKEKSQHRKKHNYAIFYFRFHGGKITQFTFFFFGFVGEKEKLPTVIQSKPKFSFPASCNHLWSKRIQTAKKYRFLRIKATRQKENE
jgi:hypothetical protein